MNVPTIDHIAHLYNTWGEENYDEDVSQRDHALQCAALAHHDGADDALVAAALLHDIGHLFEIERNNRPDRSTDLRHERVGADFLAGRFPPSVTLPIALHVEAKRFLTATDAAYASMLSTGSRRSLEVQGGPLSRSQCAQFLSRHGGADAVRLRRWDDSGKVVDLVVPDFDHWLPLLERVSAPDI